MLPVESRYCTQKIGGLPEQPEAKPRKTGHYKSNFEMPGRGGAQQAAPLQDKEKSGGKPPHSIGSGRPAARLGRRAQQRGRKAPASEGGRYEWAPGTRSFRARGTILNWTGRRASGSPSTWA